MICQRVAPALPLRQYIKEYLVLHTKFPEGIKPVKAYPVNPEEGMTFVIRGTKTAETIETSEFKTRPKTSIFGLPTSRQNLHLPPEYMMVHVRFQPGAIHKLLRIPMYELLHQYIEAQLILGNEINEVEDRLANACTYDELPLILDQYFSKKVSQIKFGFEPIERIGTMILTNPQGFSLEKTSNNACLSFRQFEKRFERQVGVTPKYFARICRFFQAYTLKEEKSQLDWLSVALHTGYNDYQHLVKDFKHFAGVTPNILLQESNLNPERRLELNPGFYGL
ncbi:MAG: AraC family transcriptional regulator [Spirosomataceae bacterium]